TVEVDIGSRQDGVEPRRPAVARPGISQAASDRHAIELEVEPVDGDCLIAQSDVTTETQWARSNSRRVAALAQPGDKRTGIIRLNAGRAGKLHASGLGILGLGIEPPPELYLGGAGCAQLQCLDLETIAIGLRNPAHPRKCGAAERD